MRSKATAASFVTNGGNFNPSRFIGPLAKDFKSMDKIGRSIKGRGLTSKDFHDMSANIISSHTLGEFGMKVGGQLTAKVIEEGISSLSSSGKSNIPFLSHNSSVGLSNKGLYKRTRVHIGNKPSSRLTLMRNNHGVDYDEKTLINTELDFQDSTSRKLLTVTTGFNEKSVGFLMEDSYLSAKKLLSLYNQGNRAEIKVNRNNQGITELYGCLYKTKNRLKFINRFQFYNASIIIHLVKIRDIQSDSRLLLESITTKFGKNKKLIVKDGVSSYSYSEGLDESDYNNSKINFDDQYTAPYQNANGKNTFLETFLTSVNCQLTDSADFNNKAFVVESWKRTLTPGSIWNFSLEHHLKKGIHINKLIDFVENNNPKHPVGYIFIFECLGDFKGKIVKDETQDFYQGFSPAKIHLEFEQQICYLTEIDKLGEENPIFYSKKRKDRDFETGSELEKTFTPKRKKRLHISYNNISTSTEKKNRSAQYTLEDGAFSDNSMVGNIVDIFTKAGLETTGLVEDDSKYAEAIEKTMEPHHEPPIDYEEPSSDESINLDEKE